MHSPNLWSYYIFKLHARKSSQFYTELRQNIKNMSKTINNCKIKEQLEFPLSFSVFFVHFLMKSAYSLTRILNTASYFFKILSCAYLITKPEK